MSGFALGSTSQTVLTFEIAQSLLKKRESKKLCNNTYLHRHEDGTISVRLHDTDIIVIHEDDSYDLFTGGWRTNTTKDRLNAYAPIHLSARNGIWYFEDGAIFEEGIIVDKYGLPCIQPQDTAYIEKTKRKLDRLVSTYIKGFLNSIRTEGLKDPSNGDCWGCMMETADGKNDIVTGMDHYFLHFEEQYYVPALLWKAIQERGYRDPSLTWYMIIDDLKIRSDNWCAKTSLRIYFRKRKPALLQIMLKRKDIEL